MKVRMMGTGATHFVDKVGAFTPKMVNLQALGHGELGYINASIKSVADCRVGDTISDDRRPAAAVLSGFKHRVPAVFRGLFPVRRQRVRQGESVSGRVEFGGHGIINKTTIISKIPV